MRRAFNVRAGLSLRQFEIPGRLSCRPPQEKKPLAGIMISEDAWIKETCATVDWYPKTGRPRGKRSLELGLRVMAHELQRF